MTEKFEFIDGEKGNYPLVCMFNWMGVSKSGYYEWHGRPDSVTARRRAGLKELRPRTHPRPGAGAGPGRLPATPMAADHNP